MPQVDTDIVQVTKVSRNNRANIEITWTWIDGQTGANKGTFTNSFGTEAELTDFMAQQTQDDVLRAVMGQCVRRDTGAFRPVQFDGLSGHSYTVNTRVTQNP